MSRHKKRVSVRICRIYDAIFYQLRDLLIDSAQRILHDSKSKYLLLIFVVKHGQKQLVTLSSTSTPLQLSL